MVVADLAQRQDGAGGDAERRRAAVQHPGGPLIIYAGPGGGKTEVLVDRALWLVREHGLAPEQLLLVAFTRYAVGEFTRRLWQQLGSRELPPVGTIHAAAARLLRAHGAIGLAAQGLTPAFAIYDEVKAYARFARVASRARSLPDPRLRGRAFAALNRARLRHPEGDPFLAEPLLTLYAAYRRELRRENALDLVDLVVQAGDLLAREPAIREQVQLTHLLVDEAQDLNAAQLRFLRLHCGPERNLTLVGDPDQAIFGWQGAAPDLLERFPELEPELTEIRLRENWRSTGAIIRAAAAVLPTDGALRPGTAAPPRQFPARDAMGEPVQFLTCSNVDVEARRAADWLAARHAAGVPWGRIALLARTHARLANVEEELLRRGVPYQTSGAGFFGRPGAREPLAYLRYLSGEAGALREVVQYPPRGLRADEYEELVRVAAERGENVRELVAGSVPSADSVQNASSPVPLPVSPLAQLELAALHEVLQALEQPRRRYRRTGPDLFRVLGNILRETGLAAWFAVQPDRRRHDLRPVHNARILQELVQGLVERRKTGSGPDPLAALLQLAGNIPRRDLQAGDPAAETGYGPREYIPVGGLGSAQSGAAGVQLLTLHASKGLEFDAVGMLGTEFADGTQSVGCHQDDGGSLEEPGGETYTDPAEELRLLYVGATRARDHLALFRVGKRQPDGWFADLAKLQQANAAEPAGCCRSS